MATAKLENVNNFSNIGLRRRPTYEEVIGLLDENKTLVGKLPNRDATCFRNSNEGSFFDGVEQMEALKDEEARLLLRQMGDILLRQNVRTAGKTFHAEKARQMPLQAPNIFSANQPMQVDEEGNATPAPPAPTQIPLTTRLQQASQLGTELAQRMQTSMKRKEETAVNHRGEVFKQTKPSIIEETMMPPLSKPRSFVPIRPANFNISTEDETNETDMKQSRAKKIVKDKQTKSKERQASIANSTIPASSNQAPIPVVEIMDVSSSSKRAIPETRIEPRGKARRPKMHKAGTERGDGTKRDGSEPEDTTSRKKRNKKTDLGLGMGEEADDEDEEPKGDNRRKTIQKPLPPYKIGIQRLREEIVNANNKGMITKEEYNRFSTLYKNFISAKGNQSRKSQIIKDARDVYR